MTEWEERTTYTATNGKAEAVVESPDASGYCRYLVRVWDGLNAQTASRGALHGLQQTKEHAARTMNAHAEAMAKQAHE